jgi:hypothetical protein
VLCGNQCTALKSVDHCGGCNLKCPEIPFATANCATGQCSFTCHAGYHACGGQCVPDADTNACGAACTVCLATAPNVTPTCLNGTCGVQCTQNFGDCNQNMADGCEANLVNDPLNCGGCRVACAGGTSCIDGACRGPGADGG